MAPALLLSISTVLVVFSRRLFCECPNGGDHRFVEALGQQLLQETREWHEVLPKAVMPRPRRGLDFSPRYPVSPSHHLEEAEVFERIVNYRGDREQKNCS